MIGVAIDQSIRKTREFLFPFQLGRWFKILCIVMVASPASGGFNLNLPDTTKARPAAETGLPPLEETPGPTQNTPALQNEPAIPPGAGGATLTQDVPASDSTAQDKQVETLKRMWQDVPAPVRRNWWVPLILVLFLFILWGWLGSCFNFIFLENVVEGDVQVRSSFIRNAGLGTSAYLWGWVVMGGSLVIFLLGAALMAAFMAAPAAGVVKVIIVTVFFFAGVFLALGLVAALTIMNDFILPIMYRDRIGAFQAWDFFMESSPGFKKTAVYILIKLLLSLVTGILSGLVFMIFGLIFMAIFFVTGGASALDPAAAAGTRTLLMLAGGGLLLVMVMTLGGLATLPFPVFLRIFPILYLESWLPGFKLLKENDGGSVPDALPAVPPSA